MRNFIDFIFTYWREILLCLSFIVSFILSLIRFVKKPVKVYDTLKEVIVRILPALINLAELQIDYSGDKKKEFVIAKLVESLKDLGYGDEVITQYLRFASEQVEIILSTPQKKEVLHGKKRIF